MARTTIDHEIFQDPKFITMMMNMNDVPKAHGLIFMAYMLTQKFWIEHKGIPAAYWPECLEPLVFAGLVFMNEDAVYVVQGAEKCCTGLKRKTITNMQTLPEGSLTPQNLMRLWNDLKSTQQTPAFELNAKRERRARDRLKEHPQADYWVDVIRHIAESSFCCGANDRKWIANFDFLLNEDTHIKALEGRYDDKNRKSVQRGNAFTEEENRAMLARAGAI